jgi:putative endonuclease
MVTEPRRDEVIRRVDGGKIINPMTISQGIIRTWFVYLLRCRTGELYTGCTNDVPRRVRAHDRGVASRFTRSRLPVILVYTERCSDRSSALRREAEIKRMSRGEKIVLIRSSTEGGP